MHAKMMLASVATAVLLAAPVLRVPSPFDAPTLLEDEYLIARLGVTPIDPPQAWMPGALAVEVARAWFAEGEVAGVHLVRTSDSVPMFRDRLAYLVRITGLELWPSGGGVPMPGQPPRPPDSRAVHHEIDVFVDASSGHLLWAESFR
jgi:hypothetical protein